MIVSATLKVVLRELPPTHEHDGVVSMTLENEPRGLPKGAILDKAPLQLHCAANPMQTYFFQIHDDRIPENRSDCVVWVGVREREISTPVALAEAVREHIDLPVGLLQQLWEDEQNSQPRTLLQEQMLRLFRSTIRAPERDDDASRRSYPC